ncbi:MAG: hypothetical protein ACYSU7_09840 [Planctomycetota bacterium]|jgi:hypothetical protein
MQFMIFNVFCILGVLLIAYWWANQGLFSAIIHLLCVITAGALAFAFWEPLTIGLFLKGGWFDRYAWSVSLVVVFALTLFILRLASNKMVPANVELPRWANITFGLPVGAASGVLTIGILILGCGFAQSQREIMGFVGYSRSASSTIVRVNSMWIPFHEITADFYGMLSVGSLRSGQPLRQYYPNVSQVSASLIRDSFRNGRGQVSLRPSQAQIVEAWVCPSRCIVKVRFGRGSRDFGEQLTLSSSQVRLISAPQGRSKPLVRHAARWRQEVKDEGEKTFAFDDISHYITTIPARETADVLIEFEWAEGFVPGFIQIKGTRFALLGLQSLDDAACDGILQGATPTASAAPDLSGAGRLASTDIRLANDIRPVTTSTNLLPGSMKHSERLLTEGTGTFPPGGQMNVARNLRILGIFEPPGTRVVQINVDRTSSANIYGSVRKQVSDSDVPVLIDRSGNTYSAVGYVHQSPDGVKIELDPSNGINMGRLPHVPTAGSQRLRLVFQVTQGANLIGFRVGDQTVGSCNLIVEARR